MSQKRAALVAIAVVIPLAIIAVSFTGKASQAADSGNAAQDKKTIITSFYPLYEFAQNVAGEKATVVNIIPAGVEPHDWEPTSSDIVRMEAADLLVINGAGFEPWADSIAVGPAAITVVDTSEGIELLRGANGQRDEGHGAADPHVWLDPVLAKQQVANIRDALSRTDAENMDYYTANANQYIAELDSLDRFIRSELAACEKTDFISFHSAFSYFGNRYGLQQHSIHGVSPEGEILPQRIREVVDLADNLGINVIYSEELIDPRLAEVVAQEIGGGRVITLSPIENIEDKEAEAGLGYIDKMRQNALSLKEGLDCSA